MITKTVAIQAFVFMEKCYAKTSEGAIDYCAPQVWGPTVWKCNVGDDQERIFVSEQTVTIEIPEDFDPRPAQLKELQAQKEKARADFAALVTSLDRQINELLAIEG